MSEITLDEIVREALQSWGQHAHQPLDERMRLLVADVSPAIADRALREALPACTACGCVTPDDPDAKECGCDAGCNDGVFPPGFNQMLMPAKAVVVEGTETPIVFDRATFEQRVNERFDEAIRKLGYESLAFMPATIAALRQQILSLDVDLTETAQADRECQS